jgi:hypothetical protein
MLKTRGEGIYKIILKTTPRRDRGQGRQRNGCVRCCLSFYWLTFIEGWMLFAGIWVVVK